MQQISHSTLLLIAIAALNLLIAINAAPSNGNKRVQKVFVHVGPSKTGTSYIQYVLSSMKTKLPRYHICWPGDERGSAFVPLADALDGDDKSVVARFKSGIDSCLAQGHDIIISSEHFHFMRRPKAFHDFFRNYNTYIIAYHREYLSKLYSHYTQHYKIVIDPISFANSIPVSTSSPQQYAENGNNRPILRTYKQMFGLDHMILVDYDGAMAAGKDIAYVILCDIMHALCDSLPEVKAQRENSRPEMLPYNVMAMVNRFANNLGCTICNENTENVIENLVERYSAINVNLPLRSTGLQALHAVAEEESRSYRKEFGSIMLFNNHSATMAVSDRFSVVELDEDAFYRDANCMRWLRQEIGKLYYQNRLCSCPSSSHALIKALDPNNRKKNNQ